MSFTYEWSIRDKRVTIGGIVTHVDWSCTATDEAGERYTLAGTTIFDVMAVLNNQPEPLTGTRPEFIPIEELTDEQVVAWMRDIHSEESRAAALEALISVNMYGDPDDEVYPPVRDYIHA